MNFELTADQNALVDAVGQIVAKPRELPRGGMFHAYSNELDATLRQNGFFDVALEEGLGPLDAALVVEAVCKSPFAVEAAASALVAPATLGGSIAGPISLVADPARAARFLPMAEHAFVLTGDGAVLLPLHGIAREPVESLMAYPMGRFVHAPDLSAGRVLTSDQTARLMTWWRVAIAIEAAAAMQAAVQFTVDYVTQRRQFNRPLGSFQAIQHRLSQRTVAAQATRWLALNAAWHGDDASAALAATYAQRAIPETVHDLHQFNGALGITLEHSLHYWTYRLNALLPELGGSTQHALAATHALWLKKAG